MRSPPRGLRKSYGDKVVLDGIDLDVPAGTVFALLGPNGAGKTTTVQILSTLIPADAGEARIAGHDLAGDPDAVRAAIGVTGQFSAVDELLTGEENLLLMADLHHLDRREGAPARGRAARAVRPRRRGRQDADHVLRRHAPPARPGDDAGRRPAGDLPRRADHRTGPAQPPDMWDIIRDLVADGVTILLTTQYLDEADQLADRIALLDHGRLVAEGTPAELKRQVPGGHVSLRFTDPRPATAAAHAFTDATRDDDALTLQVPGDGGVAVAAGRARPPRRRPRSRSTASPCTPPTSTTSSSP